MSRKKLSALSPELVELLVHLKEVQQAAEKAGLFLSDRPLLQCPACGLWEDVAFDGRLMTYFPTEEGISDTGLRFEEVGAGFRCPFCQTALDAPAEEESA